MLSPQLRRKVHDLWSLFWSSGLSNPLVAIEQITYLLFIRQLESLDRERVKQGKRSIFEDVREIDPEHFGEGSESSYRLDGPEQCRWSYIRQNVSFPLLNDTVFPWLRTLEQRVGPAQNGNTTLSRISGRLSDAYFILDPNKTETLKRAVSLIDELFRALDTRSVNSDIMGDIFEYLLEEVKESGKNGQFRTPRHVIRFMVQLLDPELGKTILDPACGSGGFLLNTLLQWKADNTDAENLRLEWDGTPHGVLPVWPGKADQLQRPLPRLRQRPHHGPHRPPAPERAAANGGNPPGNRSHPPPPHQGRSQNRRTHPGDVWANVSYRQSPREMACVHCFTGRCPS